MASGSISWWGADATTALRSAPIAQPRSTHGLGGGPHIRAVVASAPPPRNQATTKATPCGVAFEVYSGGVLLSQAVSHQVPSALRGLTTLFGKGRGGSPSP